MKDKPRSPEDEHKLTVIADLLGFSQGEDKKLPSIKEVEEIFAGTLKDSCKPGLSESEALRLKVLSDLVQVYKDVAASYMVNYLLEKTGGDASER